MITKLTIEITSQEYAYPADIGIPVIVETIADGWKSGYFDKDGFFIADGNTMYTESEIAHWFVIPDELV